MRLLKRNRWPVVVGGLYDIRECPDCAALVYGDEGQRRHAEAHENLDEDLFGPEIHDPGGIILPDIENGRPPETVGPRWGEEGE